MEASQPAYQAGGFCRDLTLSLAPIQSLISVHMSRWAGPVGEITLKHCRAEADWHSFSWVVLWLNKGPKGVA